MRTVNGFSLLCSVVLIAGLANADEPIKPELVEPAPADPVTTSASKQFIVQGGNAETRSAIAGIGEGLREKLDKMLKLEKGVWKSEISIRLFGELTDDRPPFPFKSTIIEAPRVFELKVHVGQGIQLTKLEAQILQLILFEVCLRDIPDDELSTGMIVPAWAIEGILEAMRYRNEELDRTIYQRLYEEGELMTVDQILKVTDPSKLDLARQRIFRASSGALVLALLSQAGGEEGMIAAIRSLALDPEDARATLQRRFPDLNLGKKSLEKWWALQLASMATPLAFDSMPVNETDAMLTQILSFKLPHKETGKTQFINESNLVAAIGHPNHRQAFSEAQQRLSHLSFRCFPEYRRIILRYAEILNELSQGKSRGIEKDLAELKAEREILLKLSIRTRDYLDWYEITQLGGRSGNFDKFLQAMEKLRETPLKRLDPISNYLDVIERFHQPGSIK